MSISFSTSGTRLPFGPHRKHPLVVYNLAIGSTVGGVLFGYDTAIINSANLLLQKEFKMSDTLVQHIVSAAVGAAAVFSIIGGLMADSMGRKTTIMLSAVLYTVGAVLMGVASGPEMILVGRIMIGAATGIVSTVIPVYVCECAPTGIRGTLVTLFQLFITFGVWLSSIVGIFFKDTKQGWRYMLGLAAIPGFIQFLCFIGLPESPRYQVMENRIGRAVRTLQGIRLDKDVYQEVNQIVFSIEEDKKVKGWRVWKNMFATPHVRHALFVGCLLHFFQQFTGINTIIYYSSRMFEKVGFAEDEAIWLTVIPSTVNFFATFFAIWAVEAMGRTKQLVLSFCGVAFSLLILTASFVPGYVRPIPAKPVYEKTYNVTEPCRHLKNCFECSHHRECGFCSIGVTYDIFRSVFNGSCVGKGVEDDPNLFSRLGRCSKKNKTSSQYTGGLKIKYTYDYCPSEYGWVAVVGFLLFVLAFAPGVGPTPFIITAEIYPLWCRSIASSLGIMTNWASCYLISRTILNVINQTSKVFPFLGFGVLSILAAAFVHKFLPETKDCALEEVELLFMNNEERREAIVKLARQTEEAKAKPFSYDSVADFSTSLENSYSTGDDSSKIRF